MVGRICGTVRLDTDNDDVPEEPIPGVTVLLFDANAGPNAAPIDTTTTDAQGDYCFEGVLEGPYTVVEQTPDGLSSVSDVDGPNDDTISTSVGPANNFFSDGNDFLDEPLRRVAGVVKEDIDEDLSLIHI